ncbi:ABC transporter substrate-binding protein [Erysipelothrix larvae]|uniref:ABC transporter substrate-binding protein n=1 Tax=Erysipelothrix larvae TaxID=1514105 RepID=A0A120JTN5_9FIRM|nr:zinc ABC transporter substrate-binding protein [Erysipelothrix larvae]AMC93423.1 ABC transporter substrate-binding protein [Erysipelothrix larvae]
MKRICQKLIVFSVLVVVLSGCVQDRLNVVVTSYPLEYLVERIAGDRVNVSRLQQGTVAQRATIVDSYESVINNADVIFYINELQPYFELYDSELRNASAQRVDLSVYSTLYAFQRYQNVRVSGQIQTFESAYYDSELLNYIDMYEYDPILWIDPIAMTSMGRSVLNWLVENYPDEAETFQENFESLEVDLVRLYAEYQKLRDVTNQLAFVSLTPSFGNWQKSYGINVYPIVLSKYGALPDEQLMNVYRERIQDDGVKYIAFEGNMPEDYNRLFNQVKTELQLTQINLSNLFALSEDDINENNDYLSIMYRNLDTLLALSESE